MREIKREIGRDKYNFEEIKKGKVT